jgi:phosphate transport system permease protein
VLRYDGMPKFILMAGSDRRHALVAYQLGPLSRTLLFYGDFKAWTTARASAPARPSCS